MHSATLPEISAQRTPEPPRTTVRSEPSGTPFATTLDQVHEDQARTARPAEDDDSKPEDPASGPAHQTQDDAQAAAQSGTPAAKGGKPAPAKPGKSDTSDQAVGDATAPIILPAAPALLALPVEVAPAALADAPLGAPPALSVTPLTGDAMAEPTLAAGPLPSPSPSPSHSPSPSPAPAAPTGPLPAPGPAELPAAATQAALAAQLAALAQAGKGATPAATVAQPAAATPDATGSPAASLLAALTATPGAVVPARDAKEPKDGTTPAADAASGDAAAAATAAVALPTPVVSAASAPAAKIQASAITLGDKSRKSSTGTTTGEATSAKSSSAVDALAQQQQAAPAPTSPTAPVQRPLSETIAAQDALANAGNAAEKAVSQQVGKALVQTLPGGDKMMVLRLTPPELGTVRIEVVEHQGVMSARLHAEDDGVRVALERFLPQMQRDLRAQDAPIQEVTLSDQTQFDRSFADTSRQPRDQDGGAARSGRGDGPAFAVDGAARSDDPVGGQRSLGGRVNARGVDAFA